MEIYQSTLKRLLTFLILFFGCILFVSAAVKAAPLPLQLIKDIPLPGNASRWDYASIDSKTDLLFLAHMGDDKITVIDMRTNNVIADIPDVSDVHGVLAIPELGRLYASATGTNEVVAIDIKTLKIIARIPSGRYPDGLAYAPKVNKIYISDEHGGTDTVIDVTSNTRVASIKVGREVGNTQYDSASQHIFVNEQVSNELVEINPETDQIISRTKLSGADGAHGLLINERTAYIACEGNNKLLVVDLDRKKITDSFSVGDNPDVLSFDSNLNLLYVAGEAGVVTVFKKQNQSLIKLGEDFLAPNAHVVVADSKSHLAYFPIKNINEKSVLRIMAAKPL